MKELVFTVEFMVVFYGKAIYLFKTNIEIFGRCEADEKKDCTKEEIILFLHTRKEYSITMKPEIHPENYRLVAFKDMSNDDVFITKSTAESKETIEVDGVTYPVVKLEISRTSHPFYTGKSKLVDTAGRIDKFKNKYSKFKK